MTHRTKAVADGERRLGLGLRRALRKIGRLQAARAVRSLEEHGHGLGKADPASDRAAAMAAAAAAAGDEWLLLVNPTDEELQAVFEDGAMRALASLGFADDPDALVTVHEDAVEWAQERAAELVGRRYNAAGDLVDNPDASMAITDDTRDAVRGAVADALENGLSAQELSDNIEDLDAFGADRALTIARTEIIRANNQGHLSAFRASGVVDQKEWSTAEDGDVCDDCEGNEDDGAIGLDDVFSSGDDAAPAHPNCRCVIVAVTGEEDNDESDDGEDDTEE